MYLPGIPAHVVQRGNNREACFFCDDDYKFYLSLLKEGLKRYGGELHAYCLMTNHVHWLITPQEEDSISRIVQHVGRQYVQYINKYYRRSGTLWEGRHKGSLVDADQYLLACYRYIELNPVSAAMVASPGEYTWSSFHFNGLGLKNDLITPHKVYEQLHVDNGQRRERYLALFKAPMCTQEIDLIKKAVGKNFPTGNSQFKEQIERALGRKLGLGVRGRPKVLLSDKYSIRTY